MSARYCLLDIQLNGRGEWTWFLSATNGRTLARSSESYKRRRDAERGAAITLGLLDALADGKVLTDGDVYFRSNSNTAGVEVRVLS